MRKDLRIAALLVSDGLSYQQAAKQLGLTRNQVAGACDRAGVRTGRRCGEAHCQAVREGMKRWWSRRQLEA